MCCNAMCDLVSSDCRAVLRLNSDDDADSGIRYIHSQVRDERHYYLGIDRVHESRTPIVLPRYA